MKFPNKLETKRLTLEPFKLDDVDIFLRFIENTNCVGIFNTILSNMDSDDSKAFFTSITNSYTTLNPKLAFKICLKEDERGIGSCGLKNLDNETGAICYYMLLPEYHSNGYAIEALVKLFKYAFSVLEIPKIVTYLDSKSPRAWRVAERVGMKYMGQVRYRDYFPNLMYFIIEKKEFEDQRNY